MPFSRNLLGLSKDFELSIGLPIGLHIGLPIGLDLYFHRS